MAGFLSLEAGVEEEVQVHFVEEEEGTFQMITVTGVTQKESLGDQGSYSCWCNDLRYQHHYAIML